MKSGRPAAKARGGGFRLAAAPIDSARVQRELRDARAGAFVSFEGRVRSRNDDREVRSLEYEAYPELAEKEGNRILAEAAAKHPLISAACIHRVGHLRVGDLAVWIGVTAAHRAAAFAACRYIVEAMKTRVPIWKKEHYAKGPAVWVNSGSAGVAKDRRVGENRKTGPAPQSTRYRNPRR